MAAGNEEKEEGKTGEAKEKERKDEEQGRGLLDSNPATSTSLFQSLRGWSLRSCRILSFSVYT